MQAFYWLSAALISLFSFGLWGFFSKLTIQHVDAKSALVYQSAGVAVIGFIAFLLLQGKPAVDAKGISYGLLTGIAYGVGCLFYFIAADKGKVTTVVTMTALYPIVTILLAYLILHEGINLKQGAGVILALVAIYLLS
jgi:transporter family protein